MDCKGMEFGVCGIWILLWFKGVLISAVRPDCSLLTVLMKTTRSSESQRIIILQTPVRTEKSPLPLQYDSQKRENKCITECYSQCKRDWTERQRWISVVGVCSKGVNITFVSVKETNLSTTSLVFFTFSDLVFVRVHRKETGNTRK